MAMPTDTIIAKIIELLTVTELGKIRDMTEQANHENIEVGFQVCQKDLDLFTGPIVKGEQYSLELDSSKCPENSRVVGGFHIHPRTGGPFSYDDRFHLMGASRHFKPYVSCILDQASRRVQCAVATPKMLEALNDLAMDLTAEYLHIVVSKSLPR